VQRRPWASRTQDTFFAGLFAQLAPEITGKGAAWAVAHRIGKVVWLTLHEGVEYEERGPAVVNQRTLRRKLRNCCRSSIARVSMLSPYWSNPL
jgi:hypothetical protein